MPNLIAYDRRQFLRILAAFAPASASTLPVASSIVEKPLTVRSKDGTRIAFYCQGSGPALLLVHGGIGDHNRWEPGLPTFAARFRGFSSDRRCRGPRGRTP